MEITLWLESEIEGGVTAVFATDDGAHGLVARFAYADVGPGAGQPRLVSVEVRLQDVSDLGALTVRRFRDLPLTSWETSARVFLARERSRTQPAAMHGDQRGPTRESDFLNEIARDYREALASGHRSPANEIAKARGAKASTVRSWIHRARLAGHLGPADGTRAGEASGSDGAPERGRP